MPVRRIDVSMAWQMPRLAFPARRLLRAFRLDQIAALPAD